jgi:hypothetical protein
MWVELCVDDQIGEKIVENKGKMADYVSAHVPFRRDVAPEPMAARLARFQAPLCVVDVLGNHGWSYDGTRVKAALERAGVTMLENQAIRLDLPCGPL